MGAFFWCLHDAARLAGGAGGAGVAGVTNTVDFLVVGAGIAGASVAWQLAAHGRTLVLEREAEPGFHSTGRSAALFSETYGPSQVRALSRASRDFLLQPPPGFTEGPILSPRGTLVIGDPRDPAPLEALRAELGPDAAVEHWSRERALATVPVLRPEATGDALHEPGASDIDVSALHQGFLRGLRRAGGELICRAEVVELARERIGLWRVRVADGRQWHARRVIDAAGAWADALGALAGLSPIGLQPKRRTAFVFPVPSGIDARRWPLVLDAGESWYLKPDAGQLLGSPANADPVEPHDVQAEELDVAIAIDRIERATTLAIRRPSRVWAGLRSFVADGELVIGERPDAPGFVWLAAQGGYGIQTCAAASALAASIALGRPVPEALARHGVSAEALSPMRAALRSA
jgi:D-arginine dehydrogenase